MSGYKTIEVPHGNYIGWGRKGQQVTVEVISFEPTGGSDFNNEPCPLLTGTLVADCESYRDRGSSKVGYAAGEVVMVTGGQANLKKGLLIANPKRGDKVRMTYSDTYETTQGTEGKVITVEHAPGGAGDVGEGDL